MYFKSFKTTVRSVYKLYMIKILTKSNLYTTIYQQESQKNMSITEYYKTDISYLYIRLINNRTAKKRKKD